MISIEDRIKYYIGETREPYTAPEFKQFGYDVPIEINLPAYRHEYKVIHPNTAYPIDVVRLGRHSSHPVLWFQCGDSPYTGANWPVMVKTRDTHMGTSRGIIANLNSSRHLSGMFDFKETPWGDKKEDFIWRGADTGKNVRLDFVKKFYENYDVGFSDYVQDSKDFPWLYTKELLKPKVSPEYLLTYKYLPVVDGNDKSSSLSWVMASNSVPIMPKPRYHSWFCEPWLEAGVHYVEVKRDFSDMLEKIEWCKSHDKECEEIAENGKKFALQFMNPMQEEYIERQIVKYVNQTSGSTGAGV